MYEQGTAVYHLSVFCLLVPPLPHERCEKIYSPKVSCCEKLKYSHRQTLELYCIAGFLVLLDNHGCFLTVCAVHVTVWPSNKPSCPVSKYHSDATTLLQNVNLLSLHCAGTLSL